MKKIKVFLIVLLWQIIGFAATCIISLPIGDFHYFVHELMLCLTFTNLTGLSGILMILLYRKGLKQSRMPDFLKWMIPGILMAAAVLAILKLSMALGGFICGLDQYHVERWHLSILTVNFILMTVICIVAVILSLYERLADRLATKILENEKLQRLQIETKLLLLQSKINPHFLFNTLNTMLDVLGRSPDLVEKMILNLSDIYRKTLMIPDQALVPLKEEIRLVEEYLEIEKIRMGERLSFALNVDPGLRTFKLPPMIIQILVENAIKHGLTPKKEGGEVSVRISRQDMTVTLDVRDSGVGMKTDAPSGGFGLASIRQRLKLMYENAKMEISSLGSGGTQVRIMLPYGA
ncbi:histidine kinase [bacterium]|nr:histidine kinase [bacterium]